MKHVCMLIANTCRFDSRTLREAETLLAAGCRVTILAIWDPGLDRLERHPGYTIHRLRVVTRALPRHPLLLPLKVAEWLARLFLAALRSRPDALHCHNAEPLAAAVAAGALLGKPVVYDCRELTLDRMGYHRLPLPLKWLLAAYEGYFARRCAAVIDVDEARARLLAARYRLALPALVPNYPPLIPLCPSDRLRRELGLPESLPIVLYHGLVRADRGVEELIRAVARLPGAALAILGPGELASARRLVKELGAEDRIKIPGPVEPHLLPTYTAGADLGVLTLHPTCRNNYYAAPSKVYDYLLAGLPVLLSDFPAFRELVARGVGEVVNPTDQEAVSRALEWMLGDPAQLRAMGARGRELAESELNWEQAGHKLLEVYRQVGLFAAGEPPLLMFNQKDLSVPSGETTHIVELARALSQEGRQVTVVSPAVGRYPQPVPFALRYLPAPDRPRWLRLAGYELVVWAWLLSRRALWRGRATIYVRKGVLMLAPLLAARLFGLPSVLEVNGAEEEMARQHGLSRVTVGVLLLLSRLAYRLAGRIITVTPGLAAYIERTGRVPPAKIAVLSNGANTDLFRPQDRPQCCRKVGLDPARRYVCVTGHVAQWHRLDLLVEALPAVVARYPEVSLLLVGKGEAIAGLRQRLQQLGLAGHAVFTGARPFTQVPDYVGAATVCVALATIDRLSPLKLFEYLACGRPVVVSDTVGLAEPVRDTGCGVICKPEPRALAAALLVVLEADEDTRNLLGSLGRAAAVEKYSWRATARRTLALLPGGDGRSEVTREGQASPSRT